MESRSSLPACSLKAWASVSSSAVRGLDHLVLKQHYRIQCLEKDLKQGTRSADAQLGDTLCIQCKGKYVGGVRCLAILAFRNGEQRGKLPFELSCYAISPVLLYFKESVITGS